MYKINKNLTRLYFLWISIYRSRTNRIFSYIRILIINLLIQPMYISLPFFFSKRITYGYIAHSSYYTALRDTRKTWFDYRKAWCNVTWTLLFTKCIAELRGGCGSIKSCEGVWPKFRIWFSMASLITGSVIVSKSTLPS